jgi:RNA polymerase sigma-70 factor (ECF subfamily)
VSEEQKIRKLRALDAEALSEVHNRYFPELYRYALYRLGDPPVAEDIVCEVFVRLLEALHAQRGPRTSLRGWLFGTTSHLVSDILRKSYQMDLSQLTEDLAVNAADPLEYVAQREALSAVQAASAHLTEEQQHVLALRFGSALSLSETAEIMGKKPNAIKALQYRALNTLRRHLGVGSP